MWKRLALWGVARRSGPHGKQASTEAEYEKLLTTLCSSDRFVEDRKSNVLISGVFTTSLLICVVHAECCAPSLSCVDILARLRTG